MVSKTYDFRLDLKAASSIDLPNVIAGDVGNVFRITITDAGVPVALTGTRIRLLLTGTSGTGSQDTAVTGSDITVDGSVVTVEVHADMIENGLNVGRVEIYSGSGDDMTMVTTAPFHFTAVNSASEKAKIFPSLIAAEQRFNELLSLLEYYVNLFNPDGCVRYFAQTPTANQQAQARTNIGAAAGAHVHGIIANDGSIAGKAKYLVETDADGKIACTRRLIYSETSPSLLPNLQDGDIYLVPEEE